jgi:hypothetical protein
MARVAEMETWVFEKKSRALAQQWLDGLYGL